MRQKTAIKPICRVVKKYQETYWLQFCHVSALVENDETEVLLSNSEIKNCIRSIRQRASVPAFCIYPQDPASQYMFYMFFNMLSLLILFWVRDKSPIIICQ